LASTLTSRMGIVIAWFGEDGQSVEDKKTNIARRCSTISNLRVSTSTL